MRKFILLLSICILGTSVLAADWCEDWLSANSCESKMWPSPVNIQIDAGFRRDKFKWSIDAEYDRSDALSKLQWKDLRIVQVGGSIDYVSCRNYAVHVSGDYGHIYHGENIDSDFYKGREDRLFSCSKSDAGKGSVYDLEGGVGYRVTSTCGRFIATPMAGYSYHGQNLHMYNGHQVFSHNFVPLGPIHGLNNTYKTRWFGPWVSLNFVTKVELCAYVFGGFEWHWLNYRATGKWNLRSDMGPFDHHANGTGYLATLGGNWEIWDRWSIGIVGNYRLFRARSGRERCVVFDHRAIPIKAEGRFNGAKWNSFSISALLGYRF